MFISTVNAKHKNKNLWQLLFGLIIMWVLGYLASCKSRPTARRQF